MSMSLEELMSVRGSWAGRILEVHAVAAIGQMGMPVCRSTIVRAAVSQDDDDGWRIVFTLSNGLKIDGGSWVPDPDARTTFEVASWAAFTVQHITGSDAFLISSPIAWEEEFYVLAPKPAD